MLRRIVRRRSPTQSISFNVTHGLGVVPELYGYTPVTIRYNGRAFIVAGSVLTNTLRVRCPAISGLTLDIWVMSFQGDLY